MRLKSDIQSRLYLSLFLFFGPSSLSPAYANPEEVREILASRKIDVPLLVERVDVSGATPSLWVRGRQPDNLLMARLSVLPVQAVVLANADAPPAPLWRAFLSGPGYLRTRADLNLSTGPRYFCGMETQPGKQHFCLLDADADGKFEARASAISEGGQKPYRITIVSEFKPLPQPLGYTVLADEARPKIEVTLFNCQKDYDRPRYSAVTVNDEARPLADTPAFGMFDKDSSLNGCRRGDQLAGRADMPAAPSGGFLAEIGPLMFAIGPKNKPDLKMLGVADPNRLYRMEGPQLVEISVGPTPLQADLSARQEYPYPMLQSLDGGTIKSGALAKGDVLASIPFRHSYAGVLTSEVVIRTLFSKSKVAAGMPVYAFPSRQTVSATVGGMPVFERLTDDRFRFWKLELVWCAPIKAEVPEKQPAYSESRSGWRASCLPQNSFGNHTIIDGEPAFKVTRLSFNATAASNPGPPPVRRDDSITFSQPLKLRYVFDGQDGDGLLFREEVYLGEELTSSRVERVYAPQGAAGITLAGAKAHLVFAAEKGLLVENAEPTKVGYDPVIKWDKWAFQLHQLEAIRMKLKQEPSAQ